MMGGALKRADLKAVAERVNRKESHDKFEKVSGAFSRAEPRRTIDACRCSRQRTVMEGDGVDPKEAFVRRNAPAYWSSSPRVKLPSPSLSQIPIGCCRILLVMTKSRS